MATRSWWAQTLLLTVAYYATARLTQYVFGSPTDDGAALWPAAGVALAGLLHFGARAWPAIPLATLCLYLRMEAGLPFRWQPASPALLSAMALAAGATAQAWLGLLLVRRSSGYPVWLGAEARIAQFLAVAGPVACMAGATVSVGTLWLGDRMPGLQVADRWLDLWIANSTGVLVFLSAWLVLTATSQELRTSEKAFVCITLAILLAGWTLARPVSFDWRWGVAVSLLSTGTFLATASTRAATRPASFEEPLRDLHHAAFDAHVVVDSSNRIREWNPQAERLFGWSRSEAVGLRLTDTIIPPMYRHSHSAGMRRYMASGRQPSIERVIEATAMHRDGRQFRVELKIWMRNTNAGEPEFHALLRRLHAEAAAQGSHATRGGNRPS